jgi:hypothetical protein
VSPLLLPLLLKPSAHPCVAGLYFAVWESMKYSSRECKASPAALLLETATETQSIALCSGHTVAAATNRASLLWTVQFCISCNACLCLCLCFCCADAGRALSTLPAWERTSPVGMLWR